MRPLAGTRCFYCGKQADHYDHKVPRSIGGPHIPENLVATCAACNFSKGSKTIDEFRRFKELHAASKQIEDLKWTKRQLAWLESRGLIKATPHVFWGEMPESEQAKVPILQWSPNSKDQPPLSYDERKALAKIVFAEVKSFTPPPPKCQGLG